MAPSFALSLSLSHVLDVVGWLLCFSVLILAASQIFLPKPSSVSCTSVTTFALFRCLQDLSELILILSTFRWSYVVCPVSLQQLSPPPFKHINHLLSVGFGTIEFGLCRFSKLFYSPFNASIQFLLPRLAPTARSSNFHSAFSAPILCEDPLLSRQFAFPILAFYQPILWNILHISDLLTCSRKLSLLCLLRAPFCCLFVAWCF